jgi:hypothetical protein
MTEPRFHEIALKDWNDLSTFYGETSNVEPADDVICFMPCPSQTHITRIFGLGLELQYCQ